MSHYDRIVALHVKDEEGYAKYRAGTASLLDAHGGKRLYDFRIEETLLSQTDHPINRVFLVRFPDKGQMDAFFAHPDYRAVREQFFAPAVGGATVIGAYASA